MEHVSRSVATARTLLLYSSPGDQAVLTPNPYGHPLLVEPQPVLLRAVYVTPGGDLEKAIQVARGFLSNKTQPLLAPLPVPGASGELSARIFVFAEEVKMSLSGSLHDRTVLKYVSPRTHDHSWVSDWRQGTGGYFLTGHSSTANLWRIIRLDFDGFDSAVLVLKPVRLSGDLPELRLDGIPDALIRGEITSHYAELQNALASHSYRALMTHARSIAEAAIGHLLTSNGRTPGRDLHGHLRSIAGLREVDGKELGWFSDLAYHCAQKIRLLHAMTHVDRAVKQGRSVEPELAISCVEDLKEILRETELAS